MDLAEGLDRPWWNIVHVGMAQRLELAHTTLADEARSMQPACSLIERQKVRVLKTRIAGRPYH